MTRARDPKKPEKTWCDEAAEIFFATLEHYGWIGTILMLVYLVAVIVREMR